MQHQEPTIVFALIGQILGTVRQSGAIEEESLAALRAVEAILPTVELQSASRMTIQS